MSYDKIISRVRLSVERRTGLAVESVVSYHQLRRHNVTKNQTKWRGCTNIIVTAERAKVCADSVARAIQAVGLECQAGDVSIREVPQTHNNSRNVSRLGRRRSQKFPVDELLAPRTSIGFSSTMLASSFPRSLGPIARQVNRELFRIKLAGEGEHHYHHVMNHEWMSKHAQSLEWAAEQLEWLASMAGLRYNEKMRRKA